MAGSVIPATGEWKGEQVRMGEVLAKLDDLRRQSERTATRTSVVTLVVVARDDAEAQRACAELHDLGSRHPGRTIVLLARRDAEAGFDASIRLHGATAEGVPVWSEDIVLTVRGPAADHLDSVIEPLTLPDLPLAIWYPASTPLPQDALVAAADAVLVDSRELGDTDAFPDILDVSRRMTVLDLVWIRLTPRRVLLAGLFAGAYTPFVRGVRAVEVRGKPGPRHLLAGWLSERLGLPRAAFHLMDDAHVSIVLETEHDGQRGEFLIERREGERLVRAHASTEGGPDVDQILTLPHATVAWSLAEGLAHLEPDPIYEGALRSAIAFAG